MVPILSNKLEKSEKERGEYQEYAPRQKYGMWENMVFPYCRHGKYGFPYAVSECERRANSVSPKSSQTEGHWRPGTGSSQLTKKNEAKGLLGREDRELL